MKTSFSQVLQNRLSLLLLTVSVFITAAVLWSMGQVFGDDSQLSAVHLYSRWIVGLSTTLIVLLAASLIKIRSLLRSHHYILLNNEERQQREGALPESDERLAGEELQQDLSLLKSTLEATTEGILVVDLNNK